MKKQNKNPKKGVKVPKQGDTIYIDSELYCGHGQDDVQGGKATVTKVKWNDIQKFHMVYVKETGRSQHIWEPDLAIKQKELKKEFGSQKAKRKPGITTDFW